MLLNPLGYPLLGELYSLLPIALIIATIAVPLAARGEADPRGYRPVARYVGAVSIVSLFVALYAAFGAVGALTDLVVNHADRADASGFGFYSYEFGFGEPFPVLFPLFDFSTNRGNDGNFDYTVASGVVALAAGGLFFVHRRLRRRLEGGAPNDAVVARVGRTYRAGVAAVAGLTCAMALSSMGYAIFEIVAPNIATSDEYPDHVLRMEGVAEFLAFGVLAVGSGLLFRGAWRDLRPLFPALPASRPARPAKKKAVPAKKRTR
jgi:hypothetical protein